LRDCQIKTEKNYKEDGCPIPADQRWNNSNCTPDPNISYEDVLAIVQIDLNHLKTQPDLYAPSIIFQAKKTPE
jgi:hypothetical protein